MSRSPISVVTAWQQAANDSRDNIVVVEQHAVWRSLESEEIVGESDIASRFTIRDGMVAGFARYETLDQALAEAGMTEEDSAVEGSNEG